VYDNWTFILDNDFLLGHPRDAIRLKHPISEEINRRERPILKN